MMSGRLACKASRLLGGATPHLSRSTLAAATSGAATAVPSVVAAAASTRLVLPFASINAAPFSAAATSTGERPSLGPAGSGRTTNCSPPSLFAGAIAALLSATLATSGGVASCEGPELKPEEEWPETKAVELWKEKQAGTLKDSWHTTKAELLAYAKKHGGVVNDYREFNGTLLSVMSHAALLKNIDKLSIDQIQSALLGNGWKQGGKKDEVKQRLRGCLDGTNIVLGSRASDQSEFFKKQAAERKAAGLPAQQWVKRWCDTHGGSYLHRIGQKSLTNKAMVEFRPKLLIIHGGPADPKKPKISNMEQLARDLEVPVYGGKSAATCLKAILDIAGLKLHAKSKEFDGNSRGRDRSIVTKGIKQPWDMYPQVFCNEHLDPAHLPSFYESGWKASKPSTASAKPGRAQRAKKRARSTAPKSSAPAAKRPRKAPAAKRQRKRFGDDGDSDDESYCPFP